jgi:ABC-2 type transport system permease protein
MMTAMRALVRKDLRIFFSDRRAVIMSFVAPIVIASFFGYIFGGLGGKAEVSPIAVIIVDQDGSPFSKIMYSRISHEPALKVTQANIDDARAAVKKGAAAVALIIPAGLFTQTPRPQLSILYDPSHSAERGMVEGMMMGALAGGMPKGYAIHEEAVTGRRGVPYNGYAHSFGGMGVQFILFMGIDAGIGVLLARQRGLWKRLRAAPLSRGVLLGSRAISAAITSMIILLVIFGFARVVFGVRIEGSMAGFLGVCLAFSIMTSTFGLLVAALGKTPEATRGLSIFITLIMVMLGGAWVPSFIFPPWLQKITVYIPTRWAVDGLDGMVWRGLPFSDAVMPIVVLLGFAAAFGILAVTRFRWEAEG